MFAARSNHSGMFSKIIVVRSSHRDVLLKITVLNLTSNSLKNTCDRVQLIQILVGNIKIDTILSWKYHVNDLSIKLNRANALLLTKRKYASLKILRSIYFAVFDSYLS